MDLSKMALNRLDHIREYFAENKGGYVSYQRDEERGIAYLVFMHPANNLITGKMMLDLETYIQDLSKWKTGKAIIIYGGNENFCSGIDTRFSANNLTTSFAHDLSYFMTNILLSLSKLHFITVSILTGVNEGLGAEIALYTDYILMHNAATISFNHASMGITPGLLGARRLCESVGKKVCMDLLLTCRILTAKMAKKLKLIDEIIYGEGIVAKATNWTARKIDKDAIIVQSIKRICSCNDTSSATSQCIFERNKFALLWSSHAYADALNSLSPVSSSGESGDQTTEEEEEENEEIDVVNVDEEEVMVNEERKVDLVPEEAAVDVANKHV